MAEFHLDSLAKKTKYSKKTVLEMTDNLSQELDGTYHSSIERIFSQETDDVELVKQVLWVSQTYEPLRLTVLQQASHCG
jgi:hypothetical protein